MEKKGSRSVQPSSKGLGTDSKKIQDAANKPWPRGGRRREPTGGTFSKNETSRKPISQRNKAIDKRPKPRGFYYSGAVGGKEEPRLEIQEAELGSVFVQGSKKQSLNHLLNFHFEPREGQWQAQIHSKSGHRWNSTVKHKYSKELFLQANCQFIVKESGDYKQYMNNPDALVDWDLIEQVNIHVLEFPSCPICLYPPVSAKMTRCGHIYCWSCMLHYLALSDKTWRKCPICYEAVHKKDLKSVVAIPHSNFTVNGEITFNLMKRLRGSLVAYPVDEVPPNMLIHVADLKGRNIYSKLLLATKSDVMSIIERERIELKLQLAEDENCPEKCFVDQALSTLQEREWDILEKSPTSENGINEPEMEALRETLSRTSSSESESSEQERKDEEKINIVGVDSNVTAEDLEISGNSTTASKYFYFYQALDGQHIYMHALNIRMLEHTYGALELCPKTITGRIVEKEAGSMTEELRKRLRYLQHLPITCQFEVAEIQLRSPIINKETLDHFHEQIETRRKRRQRRARDERRREKRIAEEENKKLGKYASVNLHLESHLQFPEFQPDTQPSSSLEEESVREPSSERSASPSSQANCSVVGSLGAEGEFSGLSFAKMLSSKAAATPPTWPTRKSTITPSQPNQTRSAKQSESDVELEGYVPVPAFNQSFGDAIALALEKAALNNDKEGVTSGKKKKNKQKKILFATTMGYCGN